MISRSWWAGLPEKSIANVPQDSASIISTKPALNGVNPYSRIRMMGPYTTKDIKQAVMQSVSARPAPTGRVICNAPFGSILPVFCCASRQTNSASRAMPLVTSNADLVYSCVVPARQTRKIHTLSNARLKNDTTGFDSLAVLLSVGIRCRTIKISRTACAANTIKAYRQIPRVAKTPPTIGPKNEDTIHTTDIHATTRGIRLS